MNFYIFFDVLLGIVFCISAFKSAAALDGAVKANKHNSDQLMVQVFGKAKALTPMWWWWVLLVCVSYGIARLSS